jgi:RNA polymerase sigma factor (sigma-70 family)
VSHSSHFAIDVPDSLIQRAKRGDGKAFEQIYRWFERPIYTLGLRLCGIGEFKGQSPFWGWLRQIAVNEALMRLRRTSKTFGDEDVYEMDLADGNALLPPQAAEAAQLLAAMQKLPDTTRSVLWLYHMEGFNHEEIAVQMGKSVSFSKSQLSRGTKKLRDLLIEPQTQG